MFPPCEGASTLYISYISRSASASFAFRLSRDGTLILSRENNNKAKTNKNRIVCVCVCVRVAPPYFFFFRSQSYILREIENNVLRKVIARKFLRANMFVCVRRIVSKPSGVP